MTIEPRNDPWEQVDLPGKLVSNTEFYLWLEYTFGRDNYFISDTPWGHILFIRYDVDRLILRMVYNL